MDKIFTLARELHNLVGSRPANSDLKWKLTRLLCLVRDNYTCQICGYNEIDLLPKQRSKLVIHHRDRKGNATVFPNNDLGNLQTLCDKCHSNIHGKSRTIVAELKEANPKMSMAEIGRRTGISRERVRQLLSKEL